MAVGWREAWTAAAYGPGGFYARGEAPADHFRTSVHASPLFAEAIGTLLERVDAALGRPDPLDLVDVGAGRASCWPPSRPWTGRTGTGCGCSPVEVGPLGQRGATVVRDLAELPPVTGLLVANEWLDDVPLDVVEQTPDGPRLVLVDVDGTRVARPGAGPGRPGLAGPLVDAGRDPATGPRSAGPGTTPGPPRSVGSSAASRSRSTTGTRPRPAGRRDAGRLPGRRPVPPVPDGRGNLTAHVALDSVAAAGRAAGAGDTRLDDQRTALLALGVDPRRPPVDRARTDPEGYVRALARAGEAAELTDRSGLGAFRWLVQGVGIRVPFPPAATRARVRRARPPRRSPRRPAPRRRRSAASATSAGS